MLRTSPPAITPPPHSLGALPSHSQKGQASSTLAPRRRGSLVLVATGLMATCSVVACFSASPTDDPGGSTVQSLRGCKVGEAGTPPTAPGGYYTNGATVCTASGTPHIFHGVDRPSLEFDPRGEFNNQEGIPASDFQAMASWHANVVRIATNQDYWLSNAALYVPEYEDTVDRAVHDAEAAGMDVILDLHWSDAGNLAVTESGKQQNTSTDSDQQQMADVNSQEFWSEVAAKYAGDGHVLFELYNEPNSIPWDTWINGGMVDTTGPSGSVVTFQVVGMQALYDTVRQAGANNLVIVGGLNWAFDLSGVQQNPVQGFNIVYATHPYDTSDRQPGVWPSSFGYLAQADIAPVIATEFGDGGSACTGAWDSELIQYAAQYNISWTAWAWWAEGGPDTSTGCSFPALLASWNYTPTSTDDPTVPGAGQVVKAALAMDPAVTPPVVDAGSEAGADAGPDATTAIEASAEAASEAAAEGASEAAAEGATEATEAGPLDPDGDVGSDGAIEAGPPDEAGADE